MPDNTNNENFSKNLEQIEAIITRILPLLENKHLVEYLKVKLENDIKLINMELQLIKETLNQKTQSMQEQINLLKEKQTD